MSDDNTTGVIRNSSDTNGCISSDSSFFDYVQYIQENPENITITTRVFAESKDTKNTKEKED